MFFYGIESRQDNFQLPSESDRCCRTLPPGDRGSREVPLSRGFSRLHTFLQPQPFISFSATLFHHHPPPPQGNPAPSPQPQPASASVHTRFLQTSPSLHVDNRCGSLLMRPALQNADWTRHHASHASRSHRLLVIATACGTCTPPASAALERCTSSSTPQASVSETHWPRIASPGWGTGNTASSNHPPSGVDHTISDKTPFCRRWLPPRFTTACDIGPRHGPDGG
ncbi:hypothetical protein QBC39DRAFT_88753 [Podospora conica]|nr:hypothetical protein QBC39DRAFT_88753 [Schizothecium conicum]